MSFDVNPRGIPGCYEVCPKIFKDERGLFVKTFHHDLFVAQGLETRFAEEYFSFSRQRVLRGLHFQLPPRDHIKLVYCISGEVFDVVVDLRVGSPTYGAYETIVLSDQKANMLYIPSGVAHGFYVTGESALMMYKVTTVHSPEHDAGILWNSVGIPWPDPCPVVSERDRSFVPFSAFASPFRYQENEG